MDRAKATIFLPRPLPERIYQASFSKNLKPKHPPLMLSVGLCVRTEDIHGLKIVPTTELAISIGDVDGETEKTVYEVPISMARDLAARMIAMCDAAEKGEPYAA